MGSARITIDGGCHCGAITYEADVDPTRAIICHCTDCQTVSGAPYRVSIPVRHENFRLTGEPRYYSKAKRAESGSAFGNAFCPTCGAALFSRKEGRPYIFLRTGSARQRAQLAPTLQGFCQCAMAWSADITGIAKVEPPLPA